MPLQHTHMIDYIAQDPSTTEVVLGMIELRPWDGTDYRVFQLQEKVNAYLSFALDGEMLEQFPQFSDKTVRLHLECVEPLDEKTAYFVELIREQIGFQGIQFTVKVAPELAQKAAELASSSCCGGGSNGAGGGCGCSGEAEKEHHHHHEPSSDSGCCGGGGHGGCGCSH